MNTRIFLVLGLAILAFTEISAKCACSLAGRDMCSCSGHVVRPVKPVKFDHAKSKTICHTIPGVEKLKPVGDTCSCGHQIVSPAIVPRTPCAKHAFPIVHHLGKSCGNVVRAPEEFQHSYHHHGFHDHGSVYGTEYDVYSGSSKKAGLPADAVSLGLALKLANSAARSVGEERLAYGFKKLPETPKAEEVKDIPEERLYSCDRQIVELKVPKIQQFQHEDIEEFLEEEEESEPVINTLLTYSDLGYAPEKVHHSEFIIQPYEKEEIIPVSEPHHVGHCGLQLGNVIVKDRHHFEGHHHHFDRHHHSHESHESHHFGYGGHHLDHDSHHHLGHDNHHLLGHDSHHHHEHDSHHHEHDSHHHEHDSHYHHDHKYDSILPSSDEHSLYKSEEDPFGNPRSGEWKHEDGIFLQKLKSCRYH